MLYLIGGAARTGKSTLARKVVSTRPMAWVPLDSVRVMLRDAAPDLGVNTTDGSPEKEQRFRPFLDALGGHFQAPHRNAVLEGDVITPAAVAALPTAEVRCVFLGWSRLTVADVMEHERADGWFARSEPPYRQQIVNFLVHYSQEVSESCRQASLPYVDMSDGSYEKQHEKALRLLMD